MDTKSSRIHVVDALRGFAIVSIMLLHNIEHFDFYFSPAGLPVWMRTIDQWIWDSLFFLFGGKSYAIFALLFGLTFFIQSHNQEKRGKDFRARFAWRLVLLFGFSVINSAFYEGDILMFYAIMGFVLIPVAKLSDKTVFIIAALLMIQPYEIVNLFYSIQHPVDKLPDPASWAYFGKMGEYLADGTLLNAWMGNLSNGKTAVMIWTWETGRVFQTASLFMFGMLAGRLYLFVPSKDTIKFWKRVLIFSSLLFIPLYIIKLNIDGWIQNDAVKRSLSTIETSWTNMAFMLFLVSGFVLLFEKGLSHKILKVFSPIGKMSLSNYIIQSIIGSFIYFGFGFGLYKYTGSFYCILIGITLAIFQGWFSSWWFKKHSHGPLEHYWHKWTWVGSR